MKTEKIKLKEAIEKMRRKSLPVFTAARRLYPSDKTLHTIAEVWDFIRNTSLTDNSDTDSLRESVTKIIRGAQDHNSTVAALASLTENSRLTSLSGKSNALRIRLIEISLDCKNYTEKQAREKLSEISTVKGMGPVGPSADHLSEVEKALHRRLFALSIKQMVSEANARATYQSHTWEPSLGDAVENTNPGCKHKGSMGIVVDVQPLDHDAGKTITYYCTNSGPSWKKGQTLTKTMDQLSPLEGSIQPGAAWHMGNGVGFDRPVHRPGTDDFFELARTLKALRKGGAYQARSAWEDELLDSDLGEWGEYEGERVPLDYPMLESEGDWDGPCEVCEDDESLKEAKYKGKEVELGKPKRGSGGRAYVYVRDPKTGNVKKVSFGSSMPDAMGDSDAARKRRKSFGNRHNCAKKKDRTQAGYWSCRATKFFGRNIPGWW
jgi:hypothetical protein